MNFVRITLLSFFLFSTFFVSAQTGNVEGTVFSINSKGKKESLPGVTVVLKEAKTTGVEADIDGKYTLELKPGTYTLVFSFISYTTLEVPNVVISAGQTASLNVTLEEEAKQLNAVIVTATRKTSSEAAVVLSVKKADNVVSAISAAQIGKTQDRDAAEVVKRVPGITVVNNRFLVVRGLYDRYNTVWLNDASTPSSEVDKKSFSFDVIPSSLIDRIMVYKTPSADLAGDFAGAMVKLYTRSMPDSNFLDVSLSSSYRSGTTGSDFIYTQRSSTDWLGFDSNRGIPSGTPDKISLNDPNIGAISKAFTNNWALLNQSASPDVRANAFLSTLKRFGKSKLGNTFGIFYTNANQSYSGVRKDFDGTDAVADWKDTYSENNVRAGFIENLAYYTPQWKFDFKNLLNQSGKSSALYRENVLTTRQSEKRYNYERNDRTTFQSQLSTAYKSVDELFNYNATIGYGYTNNNQPDIRRIRYTQLGTDFTAPLTIGNVDPNNGGGRQFLKLTENVYSFQHNALVKFGKENQRLELNVGNYIEYRSRDFNARILGYTAKRSGQEFINLRKLPIDQIFAANNIGGTEAGQLFISENTEPADAYKGQNTLAATFASILVPVTPQFKFIAGVRYEYNKQDLQGTIKGGNATSPSLATNFVLPSINMSYNFNDKNLVRLAYGRTLNRPEFREWSPFNFYNFDFSRDEHGSLFPGVRRPQGDTLKVATIDNVDFRYEYYPSNDEYIHAGVFYKKFTNPIQTIIGGAANGVISYANYESATTQGIEIDVRKNIYGTENGGKFTFVGNLSLISSEALAYDADTKGTEGFRAKVPLVGQSPYIINAGIYYQTGNGKTQGSFVYNVFGPRVIFLGDKLYGDIYELSRHTVDISITQKITNNISVTGGIQDLLNQSYLLKQDVDYDGVIARENAAKSQDQIFQEFKRGTYFTLGLKARF